MKIRFLTTVKESPTSFKILFYIKRTEECPFLREFNLQDSFCKK